MSKKQSSEFYSVHDLAEILGISRCRAYELCKEEGFPSLRISPRRIVIPKKAFDEWVSMHAGK